MVPVGRLDKDTSGLLLLTNDTDFANHVTDPASKVQKTYLVKANMLVSDELHWPGLRGNDAEARRLGAAAERPARGGPGQIQLAGDRA